MEALFSTLEPMKRSPATVLIVDDEPDDLFFMVAAFRAVGASSRIQTVGSGNEAVAYLEGEGSYGDRALHPYPNFIVTDLKMPGLDGFGLLEYLKENPKSATIPTVVLSGSSDYDDIVRAHRLGASSYHVKPTDATALRAFVRVLHDYWMMCEVPAVGGDGRHLETGSRHKMGGRLAALRPVPAFACGDWLPA